MDVSFNFLTGFNVTPDLDGEIAYDQCAMADIAYGIGKNTNLKYLNLAGNW